MEIASPNGPFGGPLISGDFRFRSFPAGAERQPVQHSCERHGLFAQRDGGANDPRWAIMTIWPTGEGQPLVVDHELAGRTREGERRHRSRGYAVGSVSVYVTDTTNVMLDIDGYFTPSTGSTLEFYPLTPCRVVDTRNANGHLGGPYLQRGQQRNFPVLESTCGIRTVRKPIR